MNDFMYKLLFTSYIYSKQISKMVVTTCFQRLYGVIKYADSQYDIVINIICIYLLFTSIGVATSFCDGGERGKNSGCLRSTLREI